MNADGNLVVMMEKGYGGAMECLRGGLWMGFNYLWDDCLDMEDWADWITTGEEVDRISGY